ncbi:MAG: hypothetical protein K940chlam5_01389 [Candidatus Anoxychlamydiales bacterium]|nr:hypothetical protein [Candidatus Anoxychlamydiales bacterium]
MGSLIKKLIKKLLKMKGYEIRLYHIKPKKHSCDIKSIISTDCRKIHYGCGPRLLDGWVNADLNPKKSIEHIILSMDLVKKHPFPDNFFKYGFAEDFIEHLNQSESLLFFVEAYRTLKPKGVLRLSFPGFEKILKNRFSKINYEAFFNGKFEEYEQWGHLHLYSQDELILLLKHIGFKEVYPVAYGKSNYEDLTDLDFREKQIEVNTYIEAIK